MPRPKESNPRRQWLTIRLTPEEFAVVQHRARSAGVAVSRYGRAALLGGGSRLELELSEAPRQPLPDAATPTPEGTPGNTLGSALGGAPGGERRLVAEQLRRVGVNLNQIARQLNASGLNSPRDLLELLADIRSYMDEARRA